ncbi:MAG: hypothetical protein P9M14_12375 [Candidatus Alcyoniella australis]|nr:hypothetical protein [Candidatus Alcyoniella australis]
MGWVIPILSIVGALFSACFAFLGWMLNRRHRRAEAHEIIHKKYYSLMNFRPTHPKILSQGFQWDSDCFRRIYEQKDEKDQEWVIYYSYVEMALGFCNEVIYAAKRGLLEKVAYEQHYLPLLKLLLAEHQPIIQDMMRDEPYVSQLIRELWDNLAAEGWNWEQAHLKLKS